MNEIHSISGGKISLLIVDDHAMVRQGLRTFLELQDSSALPTHRSGRRGVNGVEAVELAHRTQPDIVLPAILNIAFAK